MNFLKLSSLVLLLGFYWGCLEERGDPLKYDHTEEQQTETVDCYEGDYCISGNIIGSSSLVFGSPICDLKYNVNSNNDEDCGFDLDGDNSEDDTSNDNNNNNNIDNNVDDVLTFSDGDDFSSYFIYQFNLKYPDQSIFKDYVVAFDPLVTKSNFVSGFKGVGKFGIEDGRFDERRVFTIDSSGQFNIQNLIRGDFELYFEKVFRLKRIHNVSNEVSYLCLKIHTIVSKNLEDVISGLSVNNFDFTIGDSSSVCDSTIQLLWKNYY